MATFPLKSKPADNAQNNQEPSPLVFWGSCAVVAAMVIGFLVLTVHLGYNPSAYKDIRQTITDATGG